MWPVDHGMSTVPLNGYETLKTALDRNQSAHNVTGCSHLASRSESWKGFQFPRDVFIFTGTHQVWESRLNPLALEMDT